MHDRHRALIGATLALILSSLATPVAGQDGSPAPSGEPADAAGAPASSSPFPSASQEGPATTGRGPRWVGVRDRDVLDAGALIAAVSLGDEVIALAPVSNRAGQTRVRVLATSDGATWTRRGTIPVTGDVTDLLADGTSLYAVGWDEGAIIWRSDDGGRTWALPDDLAPFEGDADGLPGEAQSAEVAAIARGPAGLLAVGEAVDLELRQRRGAAWRSADGLAWERIAEAGGLPPFHAIAGDATTWVAAGSTLGAMTPEPGDDFHLLRWSTDGVTWAPASAPVDPTEMIQGVTALTEGGFLAWGRHPDDPDALASLWTSGDGRTWERLPADPSLAAADIAALRVLEGGALTMAVGGTPGDGVFSLPRIGADWRRDRIRSRATLCVRDVASVRAIIVVVGGTCGAPRQRGRAWTTPLEP